MRHFFFLSVLFLFSLTLHSQELRISGEVSSALTQTGVSKAVVKLLTTDEQTLLATDTTRYRIIIEKGDNYEYGFADKNSGAMFSLIAPAKKAYVLVVEAKGFEAYKQLVVPEETGKRRKITVAPIFLMPPAKEHQLGEAEVKATRIKMYYKGDTLVYNADAFNVAQTESLRKLVEQLPGAELNDGEIRINGKRIDNLLISGKNFFNGNIQAALDHLPAYVVSRLKVYDKAGEMTELTGKDMHDQNYVMDVQIKRQYIGMWTAKIQADGATEKLWGGQGLLMRFDDRQMFTLNADVNNFNQKRKMTDMGDTEDFIQSGLIETKSASLSYYFEPNSVWRLSTNASVSREDTKRNSWNNEETYLSPASLMRRSADRYDGGNTTADAEANLRARKKKYWQHELNYKFNFDRTHATNDARSLSYYQPALAAWDGLTLDSIIRLEEEKGAEGALLNSLFDPQLTRSRNISHRPTWKSLFMLGEDVLNFNAELTHRTQTQRQFSNYRLTTYADQAVDAQRRFRYRRDYAFSVSPRLEWVHQYERLKRFDGVVKPYLLYDHRYGTANHPQYRLERLAEWSEQMGWGLESLGQLPQADWQALCLDDRNSFFSNEKEERAEAGVSLSHKFHFARGTSLQIEANEAFYYQRRQLDYHREGRDYHPLRDGFFVRPALSLKWKRENQEGRRWLPEWTADYQGRPSLPELTQLLPIRDDADPLNRFVGNEALGNPFSHQVSTSYRLQQTKSNLSLNVEATYRRLHNDIATQSVYDAATGVRTYQPVNTSRTHNAKAGAGFSAPIDNKKRFFISANFSADYYQCENLSFITDGTAARAGLLRNVGLNPWLSLRGTFSDKFRVYARWTTAFRHVSQPGLTERYRETNLYADLNYTLPGDIRLGTIVRTYFYAGNSQRSYNRTMTNWDAEVGKYFLNDCLNVRIKAHDILAQGNTFRSTVTAYGRTESYTDVLPRYVMLSVTYMFNWMEKKKKDNRE